MNDLRDLYQEVILDHNRRPRNVGRLPVVSHQAVGHNPLCGDEVTVYLRVENGVIEEARFEGSGCAISTASASMMTEAVRGRPVSEVEELFRKFRSVALGQAEPDEDELGELAALSGVCDYPVRVKCATLPWHALEAALAGGLAKVTTE
ncbi:MAG: Fe-S cluster assembly sulfur transfer protein SufU [Fimbriimonadaceae bacterium]